LHQLWLQNNFFREKKVIESLLPNVEFILNPKPPRLSAFEITLQYNGKVIWSKLANPDGMNNYSHCFPTNYQIAKNLVESLIPDVITMDDRLDIIIKKFDPQEKTNWGDTNW